MKFQVFAALVASAAAVCRPGISMTYYHDAKCQEQKEPEQGQMTEYDETWTKTFFN